MAVCSPYANELEYVAIFATHNGALLVTMDDYLWNDILL